MLLSAPLIVLWKKVISPFWRFILIFMFQVIVVYNQDWKEQKLSWGFRPPIDEESVICKTTFHLDASSYLALSGARSNIYDS